MNKRIEALERLAAGTHKEIEIYVYTLNGEIGFIPAQTEKRRAKLEEYKKKKGFRYKRIDDIDGIKEMVLGEK